MKANKQVLNESFKRFQPLPNWPGADTGEATDGGGEKEGAAHEEDQDEEPGTFSRELASARPFSDAT
jgi:hypothetical protein